MGLKELCAGKCYIGAAVSPQWLADARYAQIVKNEFSSLTCENEMKPQHTMDREKTLLGGDGERAAPRFDAAEKVLSFAKANGQKVRAHTLVWHNQTPRWFFCEDWSDEAEAPLTDRNTLLKRMENYIRDEMNYINAAYPGLVYAWDVLNEFIEPDNEHPRGVRMRKNLWYQVLGEDVPLYAFTFARKYAAPGQKLFYNDYNEYEQPKRSFILSMLRPLIEKGLVDGMGLQSHLLMDYPNMENYRAAIRDYADAGLSLHVTELDIKSLDDSEAGRALLADRYARVFATIKDAGCVESVTLWGATDAQSWLSKPDAPAYPLLFDRSGQAKAAYYAVERELKA